MTCQSTMRYWRILWDCIGPRHGNSPEGGQWPRSLRHQFWHLEATEVHVQVHGKKYVCLRVFVLGPYRTIPQSTLPRNYLHCSLFKCRKSRIWSRRLKSQQKSAQTSTTPWLQLIQSHSRESPWDGGRANPPGGKIWSWKLWIRFKADGKTPKTNKS